MSYIIKSVVRGKGNRIHKYVKRTGSKGNYKYWYKMPDGTLSMKDDAHQKSGQKDHARRLVVASHREKKDMGNTAGKIQNAIADHTGLEASEVRNIRRNLLHKKKKAREKAVAEGRDVAAAEKHVHGYDDHHIVESVTPVTDRERDEVPAGRPSLRDTTGPTDETVPVGPVHDTSTEASELRIAAQGRAIAGPKFRKAAFENKMDEIGPEDVKTGTGRNPTRFVHLGGDKFMKISRMANSAGSSWVINNYLYEKKPHGFSPVGGGPVGSEAIDQGLYARTFAESEGGRNNLIAAKVEFRNHFGVTSEPSGDRQVDDVLATAERHIAEDAAPSLVVGTDAERNKARIAELRAKLKDDHDFELPSSKPLADPEAASVQESVERVEEAMERTRTTSSPESHALSEVDENFEETEVAIEEAEEAQTTGANPYLDRAKANFATAKDSFMAGSEKNKKRADLVSHFLNALSEGKTTEDEILTYIKSIDGFQRLRGLSAVKDGLNAMTSYSMDEILTNPPVDPEVERMKRGYGQKQFERMKDYIKDSWMQNNPDAPPPYPTFGDVKSWSEHGGDKPSWAGRTRLAMPESVFNAAPKKGGKPQYPPTWMPINMMPTWNYIVAKAGEASPYGATVNPSNIGQVPVYQEGIAIASIRKYIIRRGGADQLTDIPSAKLSEMSLSHEDIFRSMALTDEQIKKIISIKHIPLTDLVPIIDEEMKAEASKMSKSYIIPKDIYKAKRG